MPVEHFLPELAMLLTAVAVFAVGVIWPDNWRRAHAAALILGAVTLLVGVVDFGTAFFGPVEGQLGHAGVFFGAMRVDLFSQLIKLGLALAFVLVVAISKEQPGFERHAKGEFFLLLATSTAGMMMLASAVELLTLYVATELASFSLYILVVLRRQGRIEREAGIKYLFIGAAASAVTLYGMSLLFGMTGTTYLVDVETPSGLGAGIIGIIGADPSILNEPAMLLGVVLVLAGFFFKLAVFPFHFWAPDVYTAGDNRVVAFIASASKLVAVALLCRLLALCAGQADLASALVLILIGLSVASMTLGNLLAIAQKDFKRLLAYSAIAHAGYMVLGLLALSTLGFTSAIFYGLVYLIMSFACFFVVVQVSVDGANPQISDLAGLYRRSPGLAVLLLIGLFGLAGVPPTAGFVGKWFLFTAAAAAEHYWVVLIGAINVVVSVYYYLLVVREAYLRPGEGLPKVTMTRPMRGLAFALVVVIVVLGVYPELLWNLSSRAATALVRG